MCGIVGFWDKTKIINNDDLENIITNMSNQMLHRGPDDSGVWVDAEIGIALGHRRLAIVDLSPEGHQPMISVDGRYIIIFNGEIYNFLDIKRDLEKLGYRFRGHSDTEVMLSAFVEWGIEKAVNRFNGMFAFALWDRSNQLLHLGRDRLGEKPLYYGWSGHVFLFASELKSLKVHPAFQGVINRSALELYFRYSYIPAPCSIYENFYKLPPGCILTISSQLKQSEPIPYWAVKSVAKSGINHLFDGSEADAINHLDSLLKDAISLRMIADVPLGAFLSGGIDSSTIVALMQCQSSQPIKTFTIGFCDRKYNESEYAKSVAKHLGTEHTELYITDKEAMSVIPQLPFLYDEPFADCSQIPTFLVSQMARRNVTVALSGDGGDELFAGYNRHIWFQKIWHQLVWIPKPIRERLSNVLTQISPARWNHVLSRMETLIPHNWRQRLPGDKIHKLAALLTVDTPQELYKSIIYHWQDLNLIWPNESHILEASGIFNEYTQGEDVENLTHKLMYLDTITYLPDDILVKVDRATMAVSLEARTPYLDPRVVEFAWTVPMSMKLRNNQGKWILKQVLSQYLPLNLIDRPKMGFSIPIDSWLCHPLREWAESLLNQSRIQQEGFLNPEPIHKKWQEHLSGSRNWSNHIWDILMFQSWLEEEKNIPKIK